MKGSEKNETIKEIGKPFNRVGDVRGNYFRGGYTIKTHAAGVGDTFTIDSIVYTITSVSNNTVTLTNARRAEITEIDIPETVISDGVTYTVTEIGQSAFYLNGLTRVTIPKTVTLINSFAFEQSVKLTSITIPGNVKTIGSEAFAESPLLTDITIEEGVKTIKLAAFKDCTALTSISLPASVTYLGTSAFRGCTSLKTVSVITNSDIENFENSFPGLEGITFNYKYDYPRNVEWDGKTLKWDAHGTNYVRYKILISCAVDSGLTPISSYYYTTDNYYDFSSYMTQNGTYTAKITAVLPEVTYSLMPNYSDSETVTVSTYYARPSTTVEISNVTAVRTGISTADVSFDASLPGTMYYNVVDLISLTPSVNTSGEGTAVEEGTFEFSPTLNAAVDPAFPQYIYLTFESASGEFSEIYRIDIDRWSGTAYKITVNSDGGGSIAPSSQYIAEGEDVTFAVNPNSGHELISLTVDGEDVTSDVSDYQYTLSNLQSAHEIYAAFDDVSYDDYGFCETCGGYQPAELNGGVYEIGNAGQLFWFAALVNGDTTQHGITAANTSASAVLTNNINLKSAEWTPIGTKSEPYTGTFDGGGFEISGLSITKEAEYIGLFGYVTEGTIENLTVSGKIDVSGSSIWAGGIVGTIRNGVLSDLTSNVNVTGKTTTKGTFGGVAATVEGTDGTEGSTMENCANYGAVTAGGVLDCTGGLVGYMNSATINNCANYGEVDTTKATAQQNAGVNTGGIVGYINNKTAYITNSLNTGKVSNASSNDDMTCYTGAIVGRIRADLGGITNIYYLNTSAAQGCGENENGAELGITAKDAEELASGEVTYLINGGTTDGTQAWYQTIGADGYPVLDSTHEAVYYTAVCDGSSVTYSNSVVIHENYDENGFCIGCGGYEPAEQNSDGVYEIGNAGQLFWFAALVNGDTEQEGITAADTTASAVLTADIDLDGREWSPIGTNDAPYSGTFDGGGFEISGLSITVTADYVGLFGYVTAGTIKDLSVSGDISVSGDVVYAGGIVGTVYNGVLSHLTSVVNVTAESTAKGTVGGVAATAEGTGKTVGSIVESCVNYGQVRASGVLDCVGGIVGYMNAATITNCANIGKVDTTGGTAKASGGIYTGGIVSYCNNRNSVIKNCHNYGKISDASDNTSDTCYTGAIIGRINTYVEEVENCYYLSSSADAGCGANGSGVDIDITAKTADEFTDGTVKALLVGTQSEAVWQQSALYPLPSDEEIIEINAVATTDTGASVVVTNTTASDAAVIIAAAYDADGAMIGFETVTIPKTSGSVEVEIDTETAARIMPFIWERLDTMVPMGGQIRNGGANPPLRNL